MEKTYKIVTHDGKHHCDDVVAVAILSKVLGNVEVTRTRDRDVIRAADIAVDVGGGEYDHHQQGGNGFHTDGTPMAAAGLVWKKFGYKYVKAVIDTQPELKDFNYLDFCLEVTEEVNKRFIRPIDANDNGVKLLDSNPLIGLVSMMNRPHFVKSDGGEEFERAVDVATTALDAFILVVASESIAKIHVNKAIERTLQEGACKEIMVLEEGMPWIPQLLEDPRAENILYVVIQHNEKRWNVQCVPKEMNSFGLRKPLPSAWAAASGADLNRLTGITSGIFCHKNCFLCGCETLEDALELALIALRNPEYY